MVLSKDTTMSIGNSGLRLQWMKKARAGMAALAIGASVVAGAGAPAFVAMSGTVALLGALPSVSFAASAAPDELIRELSGKVLEQIKNDKDIQAGNFKKLSDLIDSTIMPNVNFERMTALSVGRGWRQASPEQQKQLIAEFRTLLLRTYSGALTQFKDQTVKVKPLRATAADTEVIVRSEVTPKRGEAIPLDYRMEKTDAGWKIYDVNVGSLWLVESYRNQFSVELNAKGIDGLLTALVAKNKQFEVAEKK
jgi:phospholipid transport system substrate-binding protein